MSTNTTLALVVAVLAVTATVVLVAGIRAAVQIVRVRAEGSPPQGGRIKV